MDWKLKPNQDNEQIINRINRNRNLYFEINTKINIRVVICFLFYLLIYGGSETASFALKREKNISKK